MEALEYYGGNGYLHIKTIGKFEVITDAKSVEFFNINDAREYYNSLKEDKALWDLTHMPELLECHTLKK